MRETIQQFGACFTTANWCLLPGIMYSFLSTDKSDPWAQRQDLAQLRVAPQNLLVNRSYLFNNLFIISGDREAQTIFKTKKMRSLDNCCRIIYWFRKWKVHCSPDPWSPQLSSIIPTASFWHLSPTNEHKPSHWSQTDWTFVIYLSWPCILCICFGPSLF